MLEYSHSSSYEPAAGRHAEKVSGGYDSACGHEGLRLSQTLARKSAANLSGFQNAEQRIRS
jgi:hypothetical protein